MLPCCACAYYHFFFSLSGNDRHKSVQFGWPHPSAQEDGEPVPCWRGSVSLRPFLPLQVHEVSISMLMWNKCCDHKWLAFSSIILGFRPWFAHPMMLILITHVCLFQEHCCSSGCVLVCLLSVEADQGASWMVLCVLFSSVGNIENQPQEIRTMGRYNTYY